MVKKIIMFMVFELTLLVCAFSFDQQRYLGRRSEFINFYNTEFPDKDGKTLEQFLQTLDLVYEKLADGDYCSKNST